MKPAATHRPAHRPAPRRAAGPGGAARPRAGLRAWVWPFASLLALGAAALLADAAALPEAGAGVATPLAALA